MTAAPTADTTDGIVQRFRGCVWEQRILPRKSESVGVGITSLNCRLLAEASP